MNDRKRVGIKGEEMAAQYLIKNGYQLIARNVRTKFGELDLIVEKNGEVVFVEVKLRRRMSAGQPEAAVDDKKLARLLELAETWCVGHHWHGPWRLDIVAIDASGTIPVIRQIKGVCE